MRIDAARQPVTRILNIEDMRVVSTAWRKLETRSLEPNAYYASRYASALLQTVAARDRVQFATAWKGDDLIALLPVLHRRMSVPGIVPSGRGWQTLYTFSGTPLLDADCSNEASDALVAALRIRSAGDWVLPCLNLSGPAYRAFASALDRARLPHTTFGAFERAILDGGETFEQHMKSHVSSKRRREIGRNRRRLEELGVVTFTSADRGPSLANAVDSFLALEASGWKGARGTALACQPASLEFARAAFSADAPGESRVDLLSLNGKPAAASLAILSGGTAFTIKGGYDEAYASYGVGLLLEVEILRSFLTERWANRLDAATAGGHAIDNLWPGRMVVGHLAFSFARGGRHRTTALARESALVARSKSLIRALLRRD